MGGLKENSLLSFLRQVIYQSMNPETSSFKQQFTQWLHATFFFTDMYY